MLNVLARSDEKEKNLFVDIVWKLSIRTVKDNVKYLSIYSALPPQFHTILVCATRAIDMFIVLKQR